MYAANGKHPWPASLVIVGASKAGKTHFACSMPKPLILGTDPRGMETVWFQTGYMPTDAEKQEGKWKLPNGGQYVQIGKADPTETLRLLDTYTTKLEKEDLPIESAILDGITFFSEAARAKSAPGTDHTIEKPGRLFIQHWGLVSAHLLEFLGRWWTGVMPKYHTVITALSDVRADPLSTNVDKDGNIKDTKIFPDVDTGVRSALASYVANVGYLEVGLTSRVMWFQHQRAICGSANPNLIKIEAPTFGRVYQAIYEPFLKAQEAKK